MSSRVLGGAVAALAALTLVPRTVLADQPFSGSASTTTLTVSVSPAAMLTIPSSVMSPLPQPVQNLLTAALQPITAEVDGAHSNGTRSGTANDLATGHSDVTPISLQLAPLGQLLDELHNSLTALWGGVSLPALQSTLANIATITGNSTVMGLLPPTLATQLTALNQQLSSLTTQLAAVPDVLTAAVDQLKATLVSTLTQGLTADLNSTHPVGQNTSQAAITVPPAVTLPPLVPNLPLIAKLQPFGATAVNAAGAQQFGVSGPESATNQVTTSVDLSPALSLTSLQNALSAVQNELTLVKSSIATIAPQLSGVSAIINQALPGGLDLSALGAQVDAALAPVSQSLHLAQSLQLNDPLHCNDQGSGSCALASTSVTPQGAGVHAVTASKLIDLSLFTGGTLGTAVGGSATTPLLDVQGLQATSDSFIDGTTGSQTTSGNLAKLVVAGVTVIDSGQISKSTLSGHTCQPDLTTLPDAIPIGQPLTVCIATPAGDVSVVLTVGAPQYTYTGASHRSASLAKAEIRLLNGAPDGTKPLTTLGATSAGTIATVDVGSVSSEVLGASLVPASEDGSNVVMQQTGMFGPGSLLVGFGLLIGGVLLRRRTRPVA